VHSQRRRSSPATRSRPLRTSVSVLTVLYCIHSQNILQPHPAIPVLTPWEARMVKTFLIGAPKKDSAHPEATAGRKVSFTS
jgi:hypothetical protein